MIDTLHNEPLNKLTDLVREALSLTPGFEERAGWQTMLVIRQKLAQISSRDPKSRRIAITEMLRDGLIELKKQDLEVALVLQYAFLEHNDKDYLISKMENATNLRWTYDMIKYRKKIGPEKLAQVIWDEELRQRDAYIRDLEGELGPEEKLFGIDEIREKLVKQLLIMEPPWIVAITGVGGIGKTSLATAATRQAIHHMVYEQILWLRINRSAPSSQPLLPGVPPDKLIGTLARRLFPRSTEGQGPEDQLRKVRQVLQNTPYLIVIDDLEEREDLNYLLPLLRSLLSPTKFLLTSRVMPPIQGDVKTFPLTELSIEDAGALIRHRARFIGFEALASASDQMVQEIYDIVGGNPWALRLMVGLAQFIPLQDLLTNLPKAQTSATREMFQHIFLKAWQSLSPQAQMLLVNLAIGDDDVGFRDVQLLKTTNLGVNEFKTALIDLSNCCLLETRGVQDGSQRYSIHRLTRQFVLNQQNWPDTLA